MKTSAKYFDLQFLDTVRKWQEGWFYIHDEHTSTGHEGLRAYTEVTPLRSDRWKSKPSKEEMLEVDRLMRKIRALQDEGLTGVDLIVTWLDRQVQPLQAWEPNRVPTD